MNRDLVRTLCLRQPGARYTFSLGYAPEPELSVRPAPRTPARNGQAGEAPKGFSGAIVVDADSRLVFLAAAEPRLLVNALAGWMRSEGASLPAAATLIGAGVARWDGNPGDPAAIAAVDLGTLAIHRDDRLWIGFSRPTSAELSAVLDGALPGERLWYWLADRPGTSGLPLLVQKVSADPNRDGLNAWIDVVESGSPGPAVTGIAYAADDGAIQFLGADLRAGHLAAIAAWVRAGAARHPSLARLSGCRLLVTAAGKVRQVIADDSLWAGIGRPAGPGTAAETDTLLAAMQPGDAHWFWATRSAPGDGFLALAPVAGDPEGEAFRARIEGFLHRFPGSHADAFVGTVACPAAGALRFTAARGAPAAWPALADGLARAHPAHAAMLGRATLATAPSNTAQGTAA